MTQTIDKWDWRLFELNGLWMDSRYNPDSENPMYAYSVIITDADGVSGSSSGATFEETACMSYNWYVVNRLVWLQEREKNTAKLRAFMDNLRATPDSAEQQVSP